MSVTTRTVRSGTGPAVWVCALVAAGCGGGGASKDGEPPAQPPPQGNRPPTISGLPPATVSVGATYDFRPSANDPDGDRLTFTAQNPPAWTRFDPATGRLTGTPAVSDVGRYTNIDITVSDGRSFTQLGRFSVEVTPPLGQARLTWRAPVANSDGTPLVDLAAYIVYYGRSPARLDRFVAVEDPRATSYTVAGLEPATWYFSVTAYSAAGVESDRSKTVSKAVTID